MRQRERRAETRRRDRGRTAEGERRLMQSFTGLAAERENLRDAISQLPDTGLT